MNDPFPMQPFRGPVGGSVLLPGSKSVTNRALLLAALGEKRITIENALFSRDTLIMAEALKLLGFELKIEEAKRTIQIQGKGGSIPNPDVSLEVGNAGTAARFLTAFLCLKEGGHYRLDGDPAMRRRPIRGLLDVLVNQGAEVAYEKEEGHFPLQMKTHGFRGGRVEMDARSSSQPLSALLMVAPLSGADLEITLRGTPVSRPFITMTLRMMEQFGLRREIGQVREKFLIKGNNGYAIPSDTYLIEEDATAASYFFALPLVTAGWVGMAPFGDNPLQGDLRFLDILTRYTHLEARRDGASLRVAFDGKKRLKNGGSLLELDFSDISDTFLTLAAIAPLLERPLQIRGIGHTRKQETDRVAAMASELRKLGQKVKEAEDSLLIAPHPQLLSEKAKGKVVVKTFEDHRMAMSFGILGCADLRGNGEPWLFLENPRCVEKTFPEFFAVLRSLK